MTRDNLLFILAVIIVISIIICIVKKVAKLIIFALVAFFIFTLVKGFIAGKSPMDMVNGTKVNAAYTKQLYNYTDKVKVSIQNSLNAIDNKSLPKLKEENKKLHEYLDQVIKLPHGDELKAIHDKYCN
jgi:archaellum biogenesis protein FlaJ (TadC family)